MVQNVGPKKRPYMFDKFEPIRQAPADVTFSSGRLLLGDAPSTPAQNDPTAFAGSTIGRQRARRLRCIAPILRFIYETGGNDAVALCLDPGRRPIVRAARFAGADARCRVLARA